LIVVVAIVAVALIGGILALGYYAASTAVSRTSIIPTVTVSGTVSLANATRIEFLRAQGNVLDVYGAISNGRYSVSLANDATYRVTIYWSSPSNNNYSNCSPSLSECHAGCGDFYLYSTSSQFEYDIPYNQCSP